MNNIIYAKKIKVTWDSDEFADLARKIWRHREKSPSTLLKDILPPDRLQNFERSLSEEYESMQQLKFITTSDKEYLVPNVLTEQEFELFLSRKEMYLGNLHSWKSQYQILTWVSLNITYEATFKFLVSQLKDVQNGRDLFFWQPPKYIKKTRTYRTRQESIEFRDRLRELKSTFSPEELTEKELKEYLIREWKLSAFIFLDANCKPCLHMENWRRLRSSARRNEYQPVLSFVGQNRAGKSFFVNQLLPTDIRDSINGPVQGNSKGDEACSSDIHIFEGILLPSNRKVTLLDVEGLDGGVPKTRRFHFSRLNDVQIDEKTRLQARDTYLYPLAYALADVLVYITPGSGALQGHIKKLQEMTNHVKSVSGSFTVLLIIRNFVPSKETPKDQWEVKNSTATFLEDAATVPEWEEVRLKFHPNKFKVVNIPRRREDPELFIQQLAILHALLSDTEFLPNEFGGVAIDNCLINLENQPLSVGSLTEEFHRVLRNQVKLMVEQRTEFSHEELLNLIKENPKRVKQLIPTKICIPNPCYYNNKLITKPMIKRFFERYIDEIASSNAKELPNVKLESFLINDEYNMADEFTVDNIHLTQYDWYSLVEELIVQSNTGDGSLDIGKAYIVATRPDNTLITNMSHYLLAIKEALPNASFLDVLSKCISQLAGLVALKLQEKRGINQSNDSYFTSEIGIHEICQMFNQIMSSKGLCAFERCAFETTLYSKFRKNRTPVRCINNQMGHTASGGHTIKGGFKINGEFEPSLNADQRNFLLEMFMNQIKEHIAKNENDIVKSFINNLQTLKTSSVIIAPRFTVKICMVCVRSSFPSVLLGCGHRICQSCYKIISNSRELMINCPIDPPGANINVLTNESRIPEGAGVRILCLDGGGVRGELEALVLKEVHNQSKLNVFESPINVWDGYDLIVGTSVGAMNAVFMNLLKIDPDNLLEDSKDLPKKVFKGLALEKGIKQLFFDGKYDSETLETTITRIVPIDKVDELKLTFGNFPSVSNFPRIVVTATEETNSGQLRPAWFGTLVPSVQQLKSLSLLPSSVSLIDALMASAAAPTYFSPRLIPKNGKNICNYTQSDTGVLKFLDGGLSHNNPSVFSLELAEIAWNNIPIDFLASISTCLKGDPNHPPQRSFLDVIKIIKWARSIAAYATNSQTACQEMERKVQSMFDKRSYLTSEQKKRSVSDFYFRILDWNAGKIDLDESNDAVLENMRNRAKAELQKELHSSRITRLAQRLNASMFHSNSAPIKVRTNKQENRFAADVTIVSRSPERPVNDSNVSFFFTLLANGPYPEDEFMKEELISENNEKKYIVKIPVKPLNYALDIQLILVKDGKKINCGSISGSPYALQLD